MKWPFTQNDCNYLASMESLKFGELKITSIPVYFTDLPAVFNGLLLGKAFLEHFKISLNFMDNEAVFFPQDQNFEHNIFSTGMSLKKEAGKTIIRGIWQDSPAEQSGLQVGDEIMEINGRQTQNLTLLDMTGILENDAVTTIDIKLKTKKGIRFLKLRKQKLL